MVGEAGGVNQGVVTEWRAVVMKDCFLLNTSQRMYLTVMKQACFGKCCTKKSRLHWSTTARKETVKDTRSCVGWRQHE